MEILGGFRGQTNQEFPGSKVFESQDFIILMVKAVIAP